MTVLVTGAGGFIGQNIIRYLIDKGIEIIGVYHKHKPTYMIGKMVSCNLFQDSIDEYIGGFHVDAIIHCAGLMRGKKVSEYLDNTVEITRKLINYSEKTSIGQFIYISSISAYGETAGAVDELSDRINLDDYGMTKYLCERLLEDSEIKNRIVIRLPRTLGKGCDLSYPWLPKVVSQMVKNEEIYFTNPDLMYNNMLYVDDLSEFLLQLLEKNGAGFERFVLGGKGKMRVIDILNTFKQELKSASNLVEIPVVGPNKCYAIETKHAEEKGFHSRNIEDIIRSFVRDIKAAES